MVSQQHSFLYLVYFTLLHAPYYYNTPTENTWTIPMPPQRPPVQALVIIFHPPT
ncbi:uncharacterized protein EURHEDRAFT_408986 [Aspergillus ruber CBS 135680]|uniref:Uncharacterized protein n=1 Tax=Aspergillus ruber (strain CBS 135680) TaxID=1388766 RepID=A0A017SQW0_ASPRC|nr:uncharacterized protein EURHEDRAFT_408986 [Aspergillus ruber CBS 135680]EYE98645.1 hypothetical protein EURHEDRAFT_408986 [Aspergillus ruber CBS 135680]